MLGLHLLEQREHRRQQHDRRLIVGVAARIGLGRDVVGHRNREAHSACSAVICPRVDQLAQELRRRRRQELRRDFDARDLGDDSIGRDHPARAVAA